MFPAPSPPKPGHAEKKVSESMHQVYEEGTSTEQLFLNETQTPSVYSLCVVAYGEMLNTWAN